MTAPEIPFWHVWRDDQGVSHQHLDFVGGFTLDTVSEGSAQIWQRDGGVPSKVLFLTLIPGQDSSWHENPVPQWIVPLSGRWFVTTMDGVRVEMGPGEISFGGDQGCQLVDGKRGHCSGAIGSDPAVLMLIQVEDPPLG